MAIVTVTHTQLTLSAPHRAVPWGTHGHDLIRHHCTPAQIVDGEGEVEAQDAAGRPGHVAARLRHGYLLHGVHFVLIKTVLECF